MAKSDIPFDDFVKKFKQNLDTVCEIPERQRTQLSVLLEKRFRGESLGDRIGRWNYRTHNYVEPTIDLQPFNIYTENIVKPKVRANAATMSQALIAINCDPRIPTSTRSKKNAMICQKVTDWVDDELWTNDLVLQINQMKQLTHGVLPRSFWNEQKEGRAYQADDWQEQEFDTPAQVACVKCGAPAYLEGLEPDADDEMQDEAIPTPPCKECGGATEIVTPSAKTSIDAVSKVEKVQKGDNDIELLPSMGVRVDERRSQGGKLNKCKWVAIPTLMSRFEIETEFGEKDPGEPTDWPYPLKWLYTLQTGTAYPFKSFRETQQTLKQLALFCVWRIYFTPEWLACYTAGTEYQFKRDPKQFSIEIDENARDVVMRMAAEEAKQRNSPVKKSGLCVALTGEKVLGYYLADFRKEYEYTYFVSDPYSFWALCYSELETSQHLVNQTLTAIGNQVQSNQHIGVFDRDAYDDDDLSGEKNQIYTREGNDKPVKDTYGVIEALPVTADTWHLYEQMKQSNEETSMVSKEMQGQPSTAKTFGTAQLNRDMSVGVLAPAQQSTAATKVGVCRQHCLIAQMHWQPERLQELCDTGEGIITDEDVQTWFQSDLEADVVFSYREGSEMPKSFVERRDDLSYVSNYIAQMAEFVPGIFTPQLGMDLINRVANYSTIDDLDIQNSEMDKEVAEIRYTIITEGLEQELQKQLAIPQNPQQLQAAVLFGVLQNPVLMPLKQENHTVAMEFYRDKCLLEYKKGQPNLLLVAAMQEMIERHRQALVAQGQTDLKTQMEIEALAQEQAMQIRRQAVEQEQAAEAERLAKEEADKNKELLIKAAETEAAQEAEDKRLALDQERADSDDEQAMINKVIDAQEAEKERQHQIKMQENQPKPDARA